MFGYKYTRLLLDELARLAVAEKSYDLRIDIDREGLPAKAREQFELLAQTLQNCRAAAEYDLAKYRLTNNALGVAQWDADVVLSDPVNPSNKFNWSKEFRRALGFFDESDFPDVLSSWSSRLHPEDREIVLAALAAHVTDITGKTPYDLEYRMQTKDGEYRRFRAVGLTMRDEDGAPLKVAGALEDITGRAKQQEMLENILNGMDSYIYTTDLETDEMLFANQKMMDDYHLPKSIKGEKCWQRLQNGQTGRCAWCKKDKLIANSNAAIPWEDNNPVLGNCIYKIDRVIDWPDGRRVHMQQGVDVTEMKQAQDSLRQREKTLDILNRAALVILSRKDEAFEDAMTEGIGLLSGIADFDRMSLMQNHHGPNGLRFSRIYRWNKLPRCKQRGINGDTKGRTPQGAGYLPEVNKEAKGTTKALDELAHVAYAELFPRWEGVLSVGECVNGPVSLMPEAEVLKRFACISLAAVPVLNEDVFWGFALFENLRKEKVFSEQEIDVLRSASVMLANVVIRNDEAEKTREANQYAKLMLDATPLACRLWDRNLNLLECNEAAVTLFGLKDKQEYRDRYWELAPEYQPDGQLSRDRIRQSIEDTFKTGKYVFDCMYRLPDATPLPAQNTLIRIPYGDNYVVAAYSRDLREQKRMIAEIEQRDHLLQVVNEAIDNLLRTEPEESTETLHQCMGMLARSICADRMYARVLIVDDDIMNLDVAKGFMKSYGMRTDCVTSGRAAVRAIRKGDVKYDAIFMEHMMPEMDGVEAARRIRGIGTDYARTIPIIALTANAVAGSEAMFLANGFQGFISKPIDLARLDEMIRRFVLDKEREASWKGSEEENATLPGKEEDDCPPFYMGEVDGVGVSKGVALYGGGRSFAKILRSYAVNTRPLLEFLKHVREDTLPSYAITVHGIKRASRDIFAEAVGTLAEELEFAAKAGDFDVVAGRNPAFIVSVQWLIEDIEAALGRMEDARPKAHWTPASD